MTHKKVLKKKKSNNFTTNRAMCDTRNTKVKQTTESSIKYANGDGHQGPAFGANICSTEKNGYVLMWNNVAVIPQCTLYLYNNEKAR